MIDVLLNDVLETANHIDVLAAKAVDGVDILVSRRVGGEENYRLTVKILRLVIVAVINLVNSVYHAKHQHKYRHQKTVWLFYLPLNKLFS